MQSFFSSAFYEVVIIISLFESEDFKNLSPINGIMICNAYIASEICRDHPCSSAAVRRTNSTKYPETTPQTGWPILASVKFCFPVPRDLVV